MYCKFVIKNFIFFRYNYNIRLTLQLDHFLPLNPKHFIHWEVLIQLQNYDMVIHKLCHFVFIFGRKPHICQGMKLIFN